MYPDPPVVYVYYTVNPGDGKRNRVAAFDASAENPVETITPLVTGIPADAIHNGGRIEFGPENYLWVTCGDAGQRDLAQDPSTLNGTVLRLTPSGDPAPGNPDRGDPRVFTYGHRNPQGIVWLPDGTVVATEHGPGGRDEINRLEPGANYGWPEVRQREEYPAEGVHSPLANSGEPPSWAPTGALFYTGEAVPGLRNRLLVGGLFSQQLLVATLTPPDGTLPPVSGGERHDGEWTDDAYTATVNTALKNELGRVRHVEQGPDGGLYAITSNRDGRAKDPFPREGDDVLVRLTGA
jgi:glucose/arabinose dehydrogenase